MQKNIRQLAAIMFTDMVGYTALMQEDEDKAKSNRDRHRKVLEESIQKYHGLILQYYGDGTLSVFGSAIEAVECAVEIQTELQKEPKIPLRIGLHVGEIVYADDGVYGDAVNISSRIENLSVSGGVLISAKVFDEIKNHREFKTVLLGEYKLKNVKRPIEVYAISNEGLVVPQKDQVKEKKSEKKDNTSKISRKFLPRLILSTLMIIILATAGYFIYNNLDIGKPGKEMAVEKSIAVLPFVNMSGDPDQEYFSDGITEEILNALTQLEGLKVAGRTSSFAFKGKNIDLKTIGKRLNVSTILEGSIQKSGDSVRITAQLINSNDGFHLWSERYDRNLENIFAIQDDISTRIAEKLKLSYMEKPVAISGMVPTENMEAFEMMLKGQYFLAQRLEGVGKALDYFQKAVELDPDYAVAYESLGRGYFLIASFFFQPSHVVMPKAREAIEKSISLDNSSAGSHLLRAQIYFHYDWDWESTKTEYNKAVKLNLEIPNMFDAFYHACLYNNFEYAISIAEKVLERHPLDFHNFVDLANFCNWAGRYKKGRDVCKRLLELDPTNGEAFFMIGETYLLEGNFELAIENFRKSASLSESRGWVENILIPLVENMGKKEETDQILSGLEKEASSGHIPIVLMANAYGNTGRNDDAFRWLESGFKEKDFSMVRLKINPYLKPLHSDPRWKELLDKVGFPD
jgi:TolB-like protein/class 3 adenylate cyclase